MYWKQVKQVMALSVLALLAVLHTSFSHADEGGKLTLRTREIDLFVDVLLVNEDKEGSSGVYEDANTALMTAIVTDSKRLLRGKTDLYDSFAAIGLTHGDTPALYHIDNEKLTTSPLHTGPAYSAFDDQVAVDAVSVFRAVVNGSGSNGSDVASFNLTVPYGLMNEGSEYMLVIQAASHSLGALPWLTTDAKYSLSGGAKLFQQNFGGVISVALIDKRTARAVWAMQRTIRGFEKAQMQSLKIVRDLASALRGVSEQAKPIDVNNYETLNDAKSALKANILSRDQFDQVAARLRSRYEKDLADLESKRKAGSISPPAFEILSIKAKIDYSGG